MQDFVHPLWAQIVEQLRQRDHVLHLSASLVQSLHPEAGNMIADVIRFVRDRYADVDVVERYVERVRGLGVLQQKFDRDRRAENLCDRTAAVPRDDYNIALLLSIALTNHRFEIMNDLQSFVAQIKPVAQRVVSIGAGTGFELRELALRAPASARIEAYDIDSSVQREAQRYLAYFHVDRAIEWPERFPLDTPTTGYVGALDAIVVCEVLEHLDDPLQALRTLRECLTPDGIMFVTMAINIAQEDHVFLYPSVQACRDQLRDAHLKVRHELVSPVTIFPPGADREKRFSKGNYIAVVEKA